MEGWIKVHRKIFENPVVCKDADHFIVWMYLLVNATHKDYPVVFAGNKITLHAGQLITGRYAITNATGVQSDKVYRILKLFENEKQIAKQRSSKNSLISILNWSAYQSDANQDAKQMQNRCKTDAHKQEYKNVKNVNNNTVSFKSRNYDFEKLEKMCTD